MTAMPFETNDYWARDELDRCAQTGHSQNQQENAGHQGAHEQPLDTVSRNNSKYDDHKCPGGTADLRGRASKSRDRETSDDSAIQTRLRWNARRDREGHRQREGD